MTLHNGWLRTAADVPSRETLTGLTEPLPAPPTQSAMQDEVAVYRQQLEEAYRALDDDDGFREHDGDDDRRGRRSDRSRSHDDFDEREAATPCGDHIR